MGGFIGIVGIAGIISKCYALGDVTLSGADSCEVGGFVGYNAGAISNCFARGDATAVYYGAGGFAGGNRGDIDDCFSTGVPSAPLLEGGFNGYSDTGATITNSFWDTQTSGTVTSDGGTGKTTAQMKTEATFTDAGWDFAAIWGLRADRNNGYPYLQWQYPPRAYKGNPNVNQLIYQHVERME